LDKGWLVGNSFLWGQFSDEKDLEKQGKQRVTDPNKTPGRRFTPRHRFLPFPEHTHIKKEIVDLEKLFLCLQVSARDLNKEGNVITYRYGILAGFA